MNKTQTSYLVVAALSFLVVIALLFFAATDSKRTLAFSILGPALRKEARSRKVDKCGTVFGEDGEV
jgi:hypothetical protein